MYIHIYCHIRVIMMYLSTMKINLKIIKIKKKQIINIKHRNINFEKLQNKKKIITLQQNKKHHITTTTTKTKV